MLRWTFCKHISQIYRWTILLICLLGRSIQKDWMHVVTCSTWKVAFEKTPRRCIGDLHTFQKYYTYLGVCIMLTCIYFRDFQVCLYKVGAECAKIFTVGILCRKHFRISARIKICLNVVYFIFLRWHKRKCITSVAKGNCGEF